MLSETINYIIKNVPFYRFTFANAVKPMQKFLDTILIWNSSYRHTNYSFFESQDKLLSLGKGAEKAFVYVFSYVSC